MNITQEKRLVGLPGSGQIYISGEVILYSIKDISQKTSVAYGSISRMFDAPGFASIDFGRQKLVENHALMKFFSVRRDKETRIYRFKLDRDPWGDDIYDKYYSYFTEDYRRRRKEIDEMRNLEKTEQDKIKKMVMPEKNYPDLYGHIRQLVRLLPPKIKKMDAVYRDVIGREMVEILIRLVEIYFQMANGRVSVNTAREEMLKQVDNMTALIVVVDENQLIDLVTRTRIGEILVDIKQTIKRRLV